MTGNLRVVAVDEVPEEQLLQLVATGLGAGPSGERSRAWWHWKHTASPFGPSHGVVAMDGDNPVALRMFLRWHFTAGDRRISAVRAVDTVTHPDWRRRGLFRRLTGQLLETVRAEGTAFVFNTPNRFSRPGYLRMGWHRVARVPVLIRPLRPMSLLAGIFRTPAPVNGPPTDGALAEIPPAEELLAQPWLADFLAAACPGGERFHTERTAAYFAWRYGGVPGVRYRAFWHVNGGEGALVVVRHRRRRGRTETSVTEIMTTPEATATSRAVELLREVAGRSGADYLAASATRGSRERTILRRAGFRWPPLPGPTFVVRPLASCEPDPLHRKSWQLGLGDLELF